MRIEQLFGAIESSSLKRETITIKESDMVLQTNGGWNCIIPQSSLNEISLQTDHIQFQLFDKFGNEVGSGSDFIINVNQERILIKCLSPISVCNEYEMTLIAVE